MNINQLDFYSTSYLIKFLDIRSFKQFSRTCKSFNRLCSQVEKPHQWEKELYDLYIDTVFYSVDRDNSKQTLTNIYLTESAINTVAYFHKIKENLKKLINELHSNELINFIFHCIDIFSHFTNNTNDIQLHIWEGSSFHMRLYDSTEYFQFFENDLMKKIIMESESKGKYYGIIQKGELLAGKILHNADFMALCSKLKTLSPAINKISNTIILKMLELIFGLKVNYLSNETQATENHRCITIKETLKIDSCLLNHRNKTLKSISRKNKALIVFIETFLIFADFLPLTKLKTYAVNLVNFTQSFYIIASTYKYGENLAYETLSKFLLKSLNPNSEKEVIVKKECHNITKHYLQFAGNYGIDITWKRISHRPIIYNTVYCKINGIKLDHTLFIKQDYSEEESYLIEEVIKIFDKFLESNLSKDQIEKFPVLSSTFILKFLSFIIHFKETYQYDECCYWVATIPLS